MEIRFFSSLVCSSLIIDHREAWWISIKPWRILISASIEQLATSIKPRQPSSSSTDHNHNSASFSIIRHCKPSCLYGETFIRRVIEYFSNLDWDFSQQPVSLLELYADFSMATGSLAPVLLSRASLGLPGGPKVYRLKDCCMVADMTFCDLQNQSRVWQRAIKWLLQHWQACPFDELSRTCSLSRLGYTVEQNGLAGRTKFRCGHSVYTSLWHYFHTSSGIRRAMNRKWTVSKVASTGGA